MVDEDQDSNDKPKRRVEIETIDPLTLNDALGIIGEKTRATIIIELGQAKSTDPSESNTLGYSELMKRVGAEDSGRFNYHLNKLVGPFVKKRDEGYSLRLPGQLIYEAVIAGTLTDRQAIEPFQVDSCPDCGGMLSAAYHPDHLLIVECTNCETLFDTVHFPARGTLNRSKTGILDAAYQRRYHKIATMCRGVCFTCGAKIDRALETAASITYGSASVEEMAGLETYAVLECTGCNTSLVGHPANVSLAFPVVVGFFADHDADVALERWWDDPINSARKGIEVIQEEPRMVEISFQMGEDCLRLVVGPELQVRSAERT
jgi:ferredoxin